MHAKRKCYSHLCQENYGTTSQITALITALLSFTTSMAEDVRKIIFKITIFNKFASKV